MNTANALNVHFYSTQLVKLVQIYRSSGIAETDRRESCFIYKRTVLNDSTDAPNISLAPLSVAVVSREELSVDRAHREIERFTPSYEELLYSEEHTNVNVRYSRLKQICII